ncbi:right-handed parallel beta-helix repeat-containing protein [Treponema sp. OttesenSCG-928-L16]|nr:right-handed parallel beta-helix repeat-containing protein [Treponema sp. OttesenSCG-928-L16]
MLKNLFLTILVCLAVLGCNNPASGGGGNAYPLSYAVYVKEGGTGTGASWIDALGDLQDAIELAAKAEDKTHVLIQEGTYYPTSHPNGGSGERGQHFSLRKGVTVIGGFAGTEKDNEPLGGETVLSGDSGTPGDTSDNVYHVFYHPEMTPALDGSAEMKNVTISGGRANGSNPRTYGGGMYNSCSSPALTNCSFSGNESTYGGGMYNFSNSPALENCTFSGNKSGYGGGMYNSGGRPVLTNCTFSENTAATNGGGMFNYGYNLAVYGSILVGNSAGSNPEYLDAFATGSTDNLIGDGTSITVSTVFHDIDGNGKAVLKENGSTTTRTLMIKAGGDAQDKIMGGPPVWLPDTDQRGVGRPQGSAADIGAVERQSSDP